MSSLKSKRSAIVVLAAMLSGCGGGSSSGTPGAVPHTPLSAQNFSVKLNIPISGQRPGTSAHIRAPKYVAPTTQSFSVTVNTVPTPVSVTSNISSCFLTTESSEVAGLSNEQTIAANAVDGSVWVTGSNAVNNVERISPVQTTQAATSGYIPTSAGFDSAGNTWLGQSTFSGFVPESPPNPFFSNISFASVNPYPGQPVPGNDGNMYVQELDILSHPVAALGKFVSYAWTTDVATPGVVSAITTNKDHLIWFLDGTSGKMGTYSPSGAGFGTEVAPPAGLTLLPVLAPSSSNTDVFVLAHNGSTLSIVDFTEGGAATTVATLPAAYTPANVTGMVYGADFALWLSVNDAVAGTVVRETIPNGTPFAFSTVSTSPTIPGIAAAVDGRIYYLEGAAGMVGELSLTNSCSASLPVPTGTFTITVKTFDGANGTGNQLGSYSGAVSIAPNTANTVNLTLNGVLTHLKVLPDTSQISNGCAPSTHQFAIQGLDADNNVIVTPGAFTDTSGNPITVTVTDSHGNTFGGPTTFTASGNTAINYPVSGSGYTDTITATPSGGGVTAASIGFLDQGCT